MKKYEFKNYYTHKSAEIHTDISSYEGCWFVCFFKNGECDYDLKGTGGTGEKRFTNEAAAIRAAKAYIVKE